MRSLLLPSAGDDPSVLFLERERTWNGDEEDEEDADRRGRGRPTLPAPPLAPTSLSLGDGWSGRRWAIIEVAGVMERSVNR